MKRSKDPARVSAVLAQMVEAGNWKERLAAGRLRERWSEVVGAGIAAHSEPVRLAGGVLLVRAESGSWASELALLAGRLAGLADAFAGPGLIREVRVVAGR